MLITEMIARLEEIRKEKGDLKIMIERPTGCFSGVSTIIPLFVLDAISKKDDGAALHGDECAAILPILEY